MAKKELDYRQKIANEIISMIGAYKRWEELEKETESKEEKLLFIELQKEVFALLEEMESLTKINRGEMLVLYKNPNNESFTFSLNASLYESVEYKKEYFVKVLQNPLFKQILGENAKNHLVPYLKDIGFETIGKDIYSLQEKQEEWLNEIQMIYKYGRIDADTKMMLENDLRYLMDYYWSILNGNQEKANILRREKIKVM